MCVKSKSQLLPAMVLKSQSSSTVWAALAETESIGWLQKYRNNNKNAEMEFFYPNTKMLIHKDETLKKWRM